MEYMIIGAVVIIILVWVIVTNNNYRQTEVKIEEAYSGIDIALEKRYDSVKQCFAAAKQYIGHEHSTIMNSLEYRKGMSAGELSSLSDKISQSITTLNAVSENYPDLKASGLFANLQSVVAETEENLQATRRLYNSNVTIYNKLVVSFPSSIVASIFHYEKKEFFKADTTKVKGFEIPLE